MHLQFLGRVSLFLFFFSLPALMQPLDPARCPSPSQNPILPDSARDQLTESILIGVKISLSPTLAAMFSPGHSQGDRPDTTDLNTLAGAYLPRATCHP
jgi:hypothetical protein